MSGLSIAIASFMYAGVQFIQVAWISKAYGPATLGTYALILGVYAPIVAYLSSSQRFEILVAGGNGDSLSLHRLVRLAILGLATACYLLYSSGSREEYLAFAAVILLMSLSRGCDSLLEINCWGAQRAQKWFSFSLFSVARVLPILLACAVSWILSFSFTGYMALVGSLAVATIFVSYRFTPIRQSVAESTPYRWDGTKALLLRMLPIGFAAGAESWVIAWPRYSLEHSAGLEQVGRFLIFTQIAVLVGIAASAKLQADMPSLAAKALERNKKAVLRLCLRAVFFIAALNIAVSMALKLTPSNWIAFFLGDWVARDGSLFFSVPLVAFLWYSGGYLANAYAICTERRRLALMAAFLLISVMVSGVLLKGVLPNAYTAAVLTLAGGFALRFIFSAALLITWNCDGK